MPLRVALIPFDPVVGDIHGNASRASKQARDAAAEGSNLIVFPELSLCGYPPRDLLQREGFAQACMAAAQRMAAELRDIRACVVVGAAAPVEHGQRPASNSVLVLRGGAVEARYDKRLLPTYDVFDEWRYFQPGRAACAIDVEGTKVGLLLCEDLWRAHDVNARVGYECDAIGQTLALGAHMLCVPSASPFERGKSERHRKILRDVAKAKGVPVASVNQSGSFDDLVFDGDCRVVWPDGAEASSVRWHLDGVAVDMSTRVDAARAQGASSSHAPSDFEDLWRALVCGIRGYVRRTGHTDVIVGLSGGIDSALVAALAVGALGPERVTGVLMPSVWSSPGSISDAEELARRMGMRTITLPIAPAHDLLAKTVDAALRERGGAFSQLADENLQSRLRGMQLMALSNSTGALVLTTGNKSEYAAGYTTLYGDMCGALAPIGDVLKTDVWELAKWVNANAASAGFTCAPIPEASISKVPSAELRANQTDQDTLPPYDQLDAIVREWVDEEHSMEEVMRRTGFSRDMVVKWTTIIDRAEYKRYQAAIILKVSPRAFGRGRRMPLAQNWRPS